MPPKRSSGDPTAGVPGRHLIIESNEVQLKIPGGAPRPLCRSGEELRFFCRYHGRASQLPACSAQSTQGGLADTIRRFRRPWSQRWTDPPPIAEWIPSKGLRTEAERQNRRFEFDTKNQRLSGLRSEELACAAEPGRRAMCRTAGGTSGGQSKISHATESDWQSRAPVLQEQCTGEPTRHHWVPKLWGESLGGFFLDRRFQIFTQGPDFAAS